MLRGVSRDVVAKLHDDLHTHDPQLADTLRAKVRMRWPSLGRPSSTRQKRLVLEQLRREYPDAFHFLWIHVDTERPEPIRTSPLDQIRSRTSFFYPRGQRTGGNFRTDSSI